MPIKQEKEVVAIQQLTALRRAGYSSTTESQQDEFNVVDAGVKSFVDTMTIDYRKTLNDYKNKLMDEIRKKAI